MLTQIQDHTHEDNKSKKVVESRDKVHDCNDNICNCGENLKNNVARKKNKQIISI